MVRMRRFMEAGSGATAAEYALMVGLIAGVIVGVVSGLGVNVNSLFSAVATVLKNNPFP